MRRGEGALNLAVLIPTYNRCALLREALGSVWQQEVPPAEVVVVDDGSTDGTGEMIREENAGRVKYVRAAHAGIAAARNRAVAEASAPFVVWLDSDDLLLPGTLRAYGAVLDAEPSIDVLYGQLDVIDDAGATVGRRSFQGYAPEALIPALVHGCAVPQPGACLRREAVVRLGGYDSSVDGTEDYDFYARAAGELVFRCLDVPVCRYRKHAQQSMGIAEEAYHRNRDEVVLQRMTERHGLPRMFPDLFADGTADAMAAAHFRMAMVFHDRRAHGSGAASFDSGLRLTGARLSRHARRELGGLLFHLRHTGHSAYRSTAWKAWRRWPWEPKLQAHAVLSLLGRPVAPRETPRAT